MSVINVPTEIYMLAMAAVHDARVTRTNSDTSSAIAAIGHTDPNTTCMHAYGHKHARHQGPRCKMVFDANRIRGKSLHVVIVRVLCSRSSRNDQISFR